VLVNRLRIHLTGNVLDRRVHQYQVSVLDLGKHISIAKEARQVFISWLYLVWLVVKYETLTQTQIPERK
jgi:hypothetical protein